MRKKSIVDMEKEGDNILVTQKDLIFLANYSKQADKIAIFVPKVYHERLLELNCPLKVTVEEAILK